MNDDRAFWTSIHRQGYIEGLRAAARECKEPGRDVIGQFIGARLDTIADNMTYQNEPERLPAVKYPRGTRVITFSEHLRGHESGRGRTGTITCSFPKSGGPISFTNRDIEVQWDDGTTEVVNTDLLFPVRVAP